MSRKSVVEAIISLIDKRILLKINSKGVVCLINPSFAYPRSGLKTVLTHKKYANIWAALTSSNEAITSDMSRSYANEYHKEVNAIVEAENLRNSVLLAKKRLLNKKAA